MKDVIVALNDSDLARLDAWIASRPMPRPNRAEAIRQLFDLGLDHGRDVELIREKIAQADKDIREEMAQVFEDLKRLGEDEVAPAPPPRKPN